MSDDQISDVALSGIRQTVCRKAQSFQQASLSVGTMRCLAQIERSLRWGYNNVRAAYDEVSEKIQSEVYENAKAFAKENKDRYDCYGYIYTGEGQDLGQFLAKLAVGNGKIQKLFQ